MKNIDYNYEFIFVDDGSIDDTYSEIVNLSKKRYQNNKTIKEFW